LYPNAPNPFNSQTQIIFELSSAFEVELIVFDFLGQKVASLAHGSVASGRHPVPFDGKGLSSGVYFYQLRAGLKLIPAA